MLALLFLALSLLGTAVGCYRDIRVGIWWKSDATLLLATEDGALVVRVFTRLWYKKPPHEPLIGIYVMGKPKDYALIPFLGLRGDHKYVGMPFVYLDVLLMTVVITLRPRRRRPGEWCVYCNYNLTGNVSGVCPECGTAVGK